MKKLLLIAVSFVLLFPLSAGEAEPDCFDFGISLGSRMALYDEDDTSDLAMTWGFTMGLSRVYELQVTASSQLVPDFFGENTMSVMLYRSLLGARNTGSNIAGMGFNVLAGAGAGFSRHNDAGKFYPTHILVSLTPVSAGSPSLGKRERAFTMTVGVNVYTKKVCLLFDLFTDDFYLFGTYRKHALPEVTSPPDSSFF